jgi:mono/diheme cytochrome c family protein
MTQRGSAIILCVLQLIALPHVFAGLVDYDPDPYASLKKVLSQFNPSPCSGRETTCTMNAQPRPITSPTQSTPLTGLIPLPPELGGLQNTTAPTIAAAASKPGAPPFTNSPSLSQTASVAIPKPQAIQRVSWEKVYTEVLKPMCMRCHRGRDISGGVRLDTHLVTLANLKPGDLTKSNIWKQIEKKNMPPDYEPQLSDEQIEQGAVGPSPQAATVSASAERPAKETP